MSDLIKQGDPRWRAERLGDGESSIGKAGCLLCAITECANRLGTVAHRDPRELNRMGRTAGAFVGSAALTEKLARCAGLDCSPRIDGPPDILSKQVQARLAMGKMLLLHVDHDSSKPKGDVAADHWVLAIELNGASLVYADPATGALHMMPVNSLTAESGWPDKRLYRVRGIRQLSRRPADA